MLNDRYFDTTIEELNKYCQGVNFLNEGCTSVEIETVEKQMGITLPKEYKLMLQRFNGGELFRPGTVFCSVLTAERKSGELYLNDMFKPAFRVGGIPETHLIIAINNCGDCYCIDITKPEELARVTMIGEVDLKFNSIKDFLDYELGFGREFLNYDGSEKGE